MIRRCLLTAAVLLPLVHVSFAHAQPAWPSHPIRVLVPFPAGGQLDVVVRIVAEKISPALGQPIVVETRLGADGNIAAEAVARSAPDGYTWLATSVPFATQVSLQPGKLKYDPLKDFVPVANLGTASFVLVVPTTVAGDVARRRSSTTPRRARASCPMPARRSAPSRTCPPSCSTAPRASAWR